MLFVSAYINFIFAKKKNWYRFSNKRLTFCLNFLAPLFVFMYPPFLFFHFSTDDLYLSCHTKKIFLCNGTALQEAYKVGFYGLRCYIHYLLNLLKSLIKTFPKPNHILLYESCLNLSVIFCCSLIKSSAKYHLNTIWILSQFVRHFLLLSVQKFC